VTSNTGRWVPEHSRTPTNVRQAFTRSHEVLPSARDWTSQARCKGQPTELFFCRRQREGPAAAPKRAACQADLLVLPSARSLPYLRTQYAGAVRHLGCVDAVRTAARAGFQRAWTDWQL